jgi:hypothetical protein
LDGAPLIRSHCTLPNRNIADAASANIRLKTNNISLYHEL